MLNQALLTLVHEYAFVIVDGRVKLEKRVTKRKGRREIRK
jgi:hypothetical protein